MLARKTILSWLVVLVCCAALSGCAKPPAQPIVEQQPPAETPSKIEPVSSTPQPEMPEPPPPKPDEVQQAVKHVFKDAVIIDVSRDPSFLVGDFNGDHSQDLAVVLKPAEGKLSDLNQEFPNWIAREPLEEALPKSKLLVRSDPSKASPNPAAGQTVHFEQRDVLLAIIHGYGPMGWRDPEATQTHLLRDVVGTNMRTMPYKGAVKTFNGIKPFPSIYGDLIQETLLGQSGFIHYTGGVYGWYDPKNYKLVAATIQGHPMMATMGVSSKPKRNTPGTRH